ncbi:PCRF domain-containing protein [Candidatus Vidania fulgoroideae]|uniref:PCRF domain-containing protein n=1 Tax=Candidatus Vidania fulgoroideorum TaxID=881286 RepID=A0A974X7N5_9PROT|nr:PCRF domain-containing protein [Candidatus Vidania fulgoroideae]
MSLINCVYFELKPGQGGNDSKNWAYMLMHQYLCYFNSQSIVFTILKRKTVGVFLTYLLLELVNVVDSRQLFLEAGIHKLIRVSPFARSGRVHTSTCIVRVLYKDTSSKPITLNRREIRVETFKARGPGGQSVNKTNSAVRVVHIPTGITVECQRERSQGENKKVAFALLSAKLEFYAQQRAKIARDLNSNPVLNRVYNMSKSYVYSFITKRKSSNIAAILAGNIGLVF